MRVYGAVRSGEDPTGYPSGVVLATVRHTGSLFFRGILLRAGFQLTPLRGEAKPPPLIFAHLYDTHMDDIFRWLEQFPTLVIPMRDPQECADGWTRRGATFEHFEEMWRNVEVLEQFSPSFVSIDTDDREERLSALARRLGRDLQTDWAPVNRSGKEYKRNFDASYLYDWPVIRDFYSR